MSNEAVIWPSFHLSSILSCDCSNDGVLISGAESGDVCLWDAANRSLIHQLNGFPDEVTAVCCSRKKSNHFWVASDCMILKFDLRSYSEPVFSSCYSEDDVNMIVLNELETLMGICDDSGHVTVIDETSSNKNVLYSFAEHDSCVSCIQFNPSNSSAELFSAGTDAQLRNWDLSQGKAASVVHLSNCFNDSSNEDTSVNESGEAVPAVANTNALTPPMAHSISLNNSGSLLACGLENSALLLFDVAKNPNKSTGTLKTCGLLSGHTAGVSQVVFSSSWNKAGFSDEVLISGGCDKRIISWMPEKSDNVSSNNVNVQSGEEDDEAMEDENECSPQNNFDMIKSLPHHNKINWLCPNVVKGVPVLFVADLSSVITSYSVHALLSS